jgi:hypothetical protein
MGNRHAAHYIFAALNQRNFYIVKCGYAYYEMLSF